MPLGVTMSDETLWAAFQAGDENAWDELQARHCAPVTKYTAMRVGDSSRAESIVADVFQRIRNCRERTPVAFRPWPYTLANSLAHA